MQQPIDLVKQVLEFVDYDLSKITRSNLCRAEHFVSEHVINKLFGNFTNFYNACEMFNNDRIGEIEEYPEELAATAAGTVYDSSGMNYYDWEEKGYIQEDGYWYNPETKDYLFDFLSSPGIGRVIVLPYARLHAILQAYSNFDTDPKCINKISTVQKIPPFVLKKILHVLNITHDSLPITKEVLDRHTDDDIISDLSTQRAFNIYEKFTRENWKKVQAQALKWVKFEEGVYNPIVDLLSTIKLPVVNLKESGIYPLDLDDNEFNEDETFVVCLSDLHFGAFADKNNLFYSDEDLTIEVTQREVENYLNSIKKDLENRKHRPSNCMVLSVGDIVHSLTGMTSRGTLLDCSVTGPAQFKIAFQTLFAFFTGLYQLFPENKIKVKSVSGNHDGMGDAALFACLEAALGDQFEFEITTARWLVTNVGQNIIVMEHGDSYKYRTKTLRGKAKEAFVQQILLNKLPELTTLTAPIVNKYYITGHRHTFEQQELSGFESITLPSINKSDEYADTLNLVSRPAQVCLVINHKLGITQTLRFFS